MWPLAKIGEVIVGVYGDDLPFLHIPDELQLVGLVGENPLRLFQGYLTAHKRLVGLDALPHARLDLPQVLRNQGTGQVKVVVEAILNGRPDAQPGLREHRKHRFGHDVGCGMTQHI